MLSFFLKNRQGKDEKWHMHCRYLSLPNQLYFQFCSKNGVADPSKQYSDILKHKSEPTGYKTTFLLGLN